MRRIVVGFIIAAFVLFLVGSLILWWVLAGWVPTKGKALTIETIERHLPVKAGIGAMRYDLFGGFALTTVRLADRASGETWLESPAVRIRVAWLPLALRRELVFVAHAPLTAPCQTTLDVSGRSLLKGGGLTLDLATSDVPITSITGPLAASIPPSVRDGALQAKLRLTKAPDSPMVIKGQVTGTGLVWENRPWRLTTNAALDGTATAPAAPGGRWTLDTDVRVSDGILEGVPFAQAVTNLTGEGRLTLDQLDVRRLTGNVLASPIQLEGRVGLSAPITVEALATGSVDASAAGLFLPQGMASSLRPKGPVDLRVGCRAVFPSASAPLIDCLVQGGLRRGSLAIVALKRSLTNITGVVQYDLLAQEVAIAGLRAELDGRPLAADGTVQLREPRALSLSVSGSVPLEAVEPWLPATAPVRELHGLADVDLTLRGRLDALQPAGRVELHEAAALITALSKPVTGVTGAVAFSPERISTDGLRFTLEKRPMSLQASITHEKPQRLSVDLEVPEGRLRLNGRLTPDDLFVDTSNITLQRSRLQLSGRISRSAKRPSTAAINGTLDLDELTRLPFLPLPALEAWKPQGLTQVELNAQGLFADPRHAILLGRLQAAQLSLRELPFEEVVCTIEQDEQTLRVRIPSAVAAGGRLQAQLAIQHRAGNEQEFLLEADLVGLQLERIKQHVPAWRKREVTGLASTHANFMGTWERRATWRGDGWLNAEGQNLGDVPLLDKLLRGIFGMLGDRLGLDMLRRAHITKASLQWRLAQERFHTEDARLGGTAGTEPMAIYARGSVGMDQTLDFIIDPELSESTLLQAPTTSSLAGIVLKAAGKLETLRRMVGRHTLTGTLKEPQYRFEIGRQELLNEANPQNPAGFIQDVIKSLR